MILIINRVFICILLLSISGCIASGIYLFLEKFLYQITSARFMVFINTVILFSFVIPFYYLISVIDSSESSFVNYDLVIFDGQSLYNNTVDSVLDVFPYIQYIDDIWFIGMIICIIGKIMMYLYTIKKVKQKSFIIQSDSWISAFEKVKNNCIKQNISLVGSYYTRTPYTIGIYQKYIVIPTIMINILDEEEIDFILRHEYYHASQNDVARKVFITILSCLNWFHPLFYLLKENLFTWMEIACDEVVVANFDKRQKKKYANLIIQSLELENTRNKSNFYQVCYNGNHIKSYKRRILEIMHEKKRKVFCGKVFVSALAVFSLTCSNIVAKAADIPINKLFSENISVVDGDETEFLFSPKEFETELVEHKIVEPEKNFEKVKCEMNENITYEFIFENKIVYVMEHDIEPNHIHTIVDGVLKVHKKYSDGSCITTYYEGRQCTGCGATWKGDVIKTVTENPCMH